MATVFYSGLNAQVPMFWFRYSSSIYANLLAESCQANCQYMTPGNAGAIDRRPSLGSVLAHPYASRHKPIPGKKKPGLINQT